MVHADAALMVAKSNMMIESRQDLTTNEMRLVLLAAAQLDPGAPMPAKGILQIRVADYAAHFDVQPKHAYEAVKDAAQRLYNRTITTVKEGRKGIVQTDVRIIWKAEYQEGAGVVELGFSPDIAPHLTELRKAYTSFPLSIAGKLTTFFAMRIYELAAMHRDQEPHEYSLDDMRAMLGTQGKYADWRDFNRFVLRDAVEAVNEFTDLTLTLTPVRRQRKFVAVMLHARSKARTESVGGVDSPAG